MPAARTSKREKENMQSVSGKVKSEEGRVRT
jgi:hypothetical protein